MKKLIPIAITASLITGCGEATLPACDENVTETLVGQIVNDMPLVKESGASFISLKEIQEQGYNEQAQLRSCEAILVTTSGEDALQYSIKWQNREKQEFYVEAKILF